MNFRTGRAAVRHTQPEEVHLRIAIVIERFAPDLGGVENVAWQVAHELQSVGEDVRVIARDAEVRPETPPTVPVDLVSVPTFWQPLRVARFSRRAAHVQSRAVPPFDIVHSFSRTRHQHLYRAGGGSHADYLRRNYDSMARIARQFSPRHRTLLAIERAVFADADQRIQCSSKLVADVLVESCGVARQRIALLPNGVDLKRFGTGSHRESGAEVRSREAPPSGRGPLWLFPGSGWRRKGLDRLLQALAHESARTHGAWIVGRDDPRPWQRRATQLGVGDRIRFLGERRDLEKYYEAADGMVLPTRYDPFANVTLEAAAAGLPIVTSDANGAAEWLGNEIRVVEACDDAGTLAAALAGFESPERRKRAGNDLAGRAAGFGWAPHVSRLRALYAEIVEGRTEAASR